MRGVAHNLQMYLRVHAYVVPVPTGTYVYTCQADKSLIKALTTENTV
jgi:hypothetical protein